VDDIGDFLSDFGSNQIQHKFFIPCGTCDSFLFFTKLGYSVKRVSQTLAGIALDSRRSAEGNQAGKIGESRPHAIPYKREETDIDSARAYIDHLKQSLGRRT
jgi:hypothetical protein